MTLSTFKCPSESRCSMSSTPMGRLWPTLATIFTRNKFETIRLTLPTAPSPITTHFMVCMLVAWDGVKSLKRPSYTSGVAVLPIFHLLNQFLRLVFFDFIKIIFGNKSVQSQTFNPSTSCKMSLVEDDLEIGDLFPVST